MLVAATHFQLRARCLLGPFLAASFRAAKQAAKSNGLRAGWLLADGLSAFWTLTAWKDDESMRAYRNSNPHLQITAGFPRWCQKGAFVHWSQAEDRLPDWREAHRRIGTDGTVLQARRGDGVLIPIAGTILPVPRPGRFNTLRIVPGVGLKVEAGSPCAEWMRDRYLQPRIAQEGGGMTPQSEAMNMEIERPGRPIGTHGTESVVDSPAGSAVPTHEAMREVRTLDEFRELSYLGGFVVIIDRPTRRSVLHRWTCAYVREAAFIEKVVENGGANGAYHWVDSRELAVRVLHARECRSCLR